ncbi:MAG: hypothetical protein IJU03_04800 [Thermoguttaceae bacterium]|nr:hypothetical protein [Thermoguttaceae bacterium]
MTFLLNKRVATILYVLLVAFSLVNYNASPVRVLYAQDAQEASPVDYCADYVAFAERFIRPAFPENGSADEQKNWYALKKTCGRDLIKLSLAKWPAFDAKPNDVSDDAWKGFVALQELSRFHIAETIFDENHGGTLIKKYYTTDYEPDKIIALDKIAHEEVAKVGEAIDALTSDELWKAQRRCELDLFYADFDRWFAPYCQASLSKLPPFEEFAKSPDLFLTTADLLEFALRYIPDAPEFVAALEGVQELLRAPKAVEIRVFHGRYEGFELVPRDVIFARYCARIDAVANARDEKNLAPKLTDAEIFNERQTERFVHDSLPQWGAKNPEQSDYFYIVFPKTGPAEGRPLYVVLHSAGHSAKTALDCTLTVGNHDIYTVPDDFYGIFVDCYDNKDTDWWWGGRRADEPEINDSNRERATGELQPVEKRVRDEIAWAIETYKIDANRVYLCGNSMGGSGTLGLGFANGDLFAAVKANVPAGVWHAYDRLQLGEENAPARVADPPVVFDYSAPNDHWSDYHEALVEGVEKRKYAYVLYWGNFGHENNDEKVLKVNDLFKTFDWTSIRKDEAYPAFTNASCDSPLAWPDRRDDAPAGQRGAYFRWTVVDDSESKFEIELRLASKEELNSTIFEIPTAATADVSLRRLQNFVVEPNAEISWRFGDASGKVKADRNGLVTIPQLTVETNGKTLRLEK